MENTPLTGTTTTTPTNRDGKPTKRYYGPLRAASLALLLGLSFYLGGHRGSGTNLSREEQETPNVAASSSSLSLVGSGTTASDLKTLTLVVDDDELIDGVLSGGPPAEKPKGGSSAYCKKNTGYNCGAVFPPNGDTCGHKGCCCRPEDGTGYKMDTCGSAKGYAYRGCNSCWGRGACTRTNNINVGTSSCHDMHSCDSVSDSTIDNVSCHGRTACQGVQNSIIHKGSCQGEKTCYQVTNSIIGEGSCNNGSNSCHYLKNVTVGNNSCNGEEACWGWVNPIKNVTVGNNSCNGEEVCWGCKHNVPDNACNQGSTDDMTDGRCNFCG